MFRIALTPCSPARRTRMYQLRCQSGLGTARAGPGRPDLPRSSRRERPSRRRARRAGGAGRLGRPLGPPRAGAAASAPETQTHAQSARAGSVRGGSWGHCRRRCSLRTIMSPSARAPATANLAQGRPFLSESDRDPRGPGEGRGGFLPRRKQVCGARPRGNAARPPSPAQGSRRRQPAGFSIRSTISNNNLL